MKFKDFAFVNLLIISINGINSCNSQIITVLSKDFFQLTHVRYGTIFACLNAYDMVSIAKNITHTNKIRVAVKNLKALAFHDNIEMNNYFHAMFVGVEIFHSGIVLDLNCPGSQELLKFASIMELFDSTHHWLLIEGENIENSIENLKFMGLRLDNNVLLASKVHATDDHWTILDVYNSGYNIGGRLYITFFGFWSPKNDIILFQKTKNQIESICTISSVKFYISGRWQIYLLQGVIARRQDLKNLVLDASIATTFHPPKGGYIKYLSTPTNIDMDSMHRHNYALFLLIMDLFNFRIKLLRTDSWGIVKNGTWTGIIGTLVNGNVEVSITPTQLNIERVGIVDQTAVSWIARTAILFRHPQGGGLRNQFFKPLATSVWWSSLVITIISTVVYRLTLSQETKRANNSDNNDDSWSYTLLIAITGVFCQQGFPHTPGIYSGRTVAYLWLLFTFLLYQFYSASIVSSLLSEQPKTINNLHDIMNSKLQVLIEDIRYNYDFFETSNDPFISEFYRKKVTPDGTTKHFITSKHCLEKIKQGGYACQIDLATAYKLIPGYFGEKAICELTEVPLFAPKRTIMAVRRGSPYRQMITYGLRKIHESGLLQYQKTVWQSPKPKCTLGSASESVMVDLQETSTAFIFLLFSYLISLLILGIERCAHKKNETCNPK